MIIGAAALALTVFAGNLDIMRGIRRFLAVIAIGWFAFLFYRGEVTNTLATPYMHEAMAWSLYIYGFGWLLTFIAYGFKAKTPKGTLVERSDGVAFVVRPRRFWH